MTRYRHFTLLISIINACLFGVVLLLFIILRHNDVKIQQTINMLYFDHKPTQIGKLLVTQRSVQWHGKRNLNDIIRCVNRQLRNRDILVCD